MPVCMVLSLPLMAVPFLPEVWMVMLVLFGALIAISAWGAPLLQARPVETAVSDSGASRDPWATLLAVVRRGPGMTTGYKYGAERRVREVGGGQMSSKGQVRRPRNRQGEGGGD